LQEQHSRSIGIGGLVNKELNRFSDLVGMRIWPTMASTLNLHQPTIRQRFFKKLNRTPMMLGSPRTRHR
jgi:hypothetical protein